MPLPKPKKGESQSEFMDRCVDDKTMKQEFKDKDQRLAVCIYQWEKNK